MSFVIDRVTYTQTALESPPLQEPNGPAPTGPSPADEAKKVIDKKLHDEGWLDDVTHEELRDINKELGKLPPQQRNDVISKMSDEQLKTWADEVDSNGIFGAGGLSDGEKQALFDMLAEGLDGKQLARVAGAFNSEADAKRLGDTIAAKASPQAKADFVKEMAPRAANDPRAALQIAKAIGGLKGHPAEVDAALAALIKSGNLGAVIDAAKQLWTQYGDHSVSAKYEVEPLVNLIDAAATGNNPELKAQVFEAAARQVKQIAESGNTPGAAVFKNGAEEKITRALTQLLTSDTNGVMRELEQDFRDGRGISAYTEQMIRLEHTQDLEVIIEQLKYGNNLDGDAIKRFEATEGPDRAHRNAQTLGYFVGGIHAGVSAVTRSLDVQANIVKAIFGGTVSGGKDLATNTWLTASTQKAVAGAVAAVVGATGVIGTDAIVRDLKANLRDLRDALGELAYPREADGQAYENEPVETAYDNAKGRVIDANSHT
ncbi:hypothetical protein OOT46_03480 [Aquabacterium sp. A7-Y]|uniref:hypothetical protein n=1 Tax=Aquabacterium sp. A7-Y TaxID=1349605 RepID=UPI00223D44E9|nr:hypothetical protein [Aquabacterium sp. A7-Y]MCW7536915.1 hypothetical protein [Aquabacterium sp. A7-Y]